MSITLSMIGVRTLLVLFAVRNVRMIGESVKNSTRKKVCDDTCEIRTHAGIAHGLSRAAP